MANSLSSNITRPLARVFLDAFESNRVVTKTVNTQLLSGRFNPSTGGTVDFKRPHDYNSIRTAGGDISASTKSDIIAGKASGTVQDYFTVATEWTNIQEALELDQLDEILAPMARRIVTDLETDLADYMMKNSSLKYGDHGTAVDAWSDVAGAGALMDSVGVPMSDDTYYLMNPFTTTSLASAQSGLSAADGLVRTAWEKAQISSNFGGMKAGDMVKVTGVNRLNISTRQPMIDAAGANVLWTGVVVADVTLSGTGTGNIVVAGPAIYEAAGQYNTVDAAPVITDVVTLSSAASTLYQPNLFYTKQAFGLGTVKLPKLYATDTVATTSDGMSIRVTKYSDGDSNTQKVRFDLLPAYATFNPFFAGQGFGV